MSDGVTFQPLISIVPQESKPHRSFIALVVIGVSIVFLLLTIAFVYVLTTNIQLKYKLESCQKTTQSS